MINKPRDNEEAEFATPIVRADASSPQQMALAHQLATMAEAAREACETENDE